MLRPKNAQMAPFVQRPPDLTLTRDASCLGWGALCLSHRLSGLRTAEESKGHINLFELKSVLLALQELDPLVAGRLILV